MAARVERADNRIAVGQPWIFYDTSIDAIAAVHDCRSVALVLPERTDLNDGSGRLGTPPKGSTGDNARFEWMPVRVQWARRPRRRKVRSPKLFDHDFLHDSGDLGDGLVRRQALYEPDAHTREVRRTHQCGPSIATRVVARFGHLQHDGCSCCHVAKDWSKRRLKCGVNHGLDLATSRSHDKRRDITADRCFGCPGPPGTMYA